jgi:peptide-methionine (S)-S-oxide reductase
MENVTDKTSHEIAVFGGGCFWCTEAVFNSLKGVSTVMPGYSGGTVANPSYEQVSTGNTGHVECTKVEFDPKIISFKDLLNVFFHTHDPTTLNRQGNDIGNQYRSVIFYITEEQKNIATAFLQELENNHAYDKPIVTKIELLSKFYDAEGYHQKYYENHIESRYCEMVIAPKLEKLQERFAELVKN